MTRATVSCGPNGATRRADDFSGFFRSRRRRALVLALRSPQPLTGRIPGPTFATRWASRFLRIAALGERAADRQLARFGGDPRNKSKICDAGLWVYSRHPNYFFEWLVWVSFAMIAIAPAGHYPWGWFGLAGPVLMYALLVHVSGIPPLEAHMLRSRGDAFRLYQARVNAFWPGQPKAPAEALRIRSPLMSLITAATRFVERAPLPDALSKLGVAALVDRTSRSLSGRPEASEVDFVRDMDQFPVALHVQAANQQHYELPADFFGLGSGRARKYSCCLYPTDGETLAEAETLARSTAARRAD